LMRSRSASEVGPPAASSASRTSAPGGSVTTSGCLTAPLTYTRIGPGVAVGAGVGVGGGASTTIGAAGCIRSATATSPVATSTPTSASTSVRCFSSQSFTARNLRFAGEDQEVDELSGQPKLSYQRP